jgi:hypothetical protein
MERKNQIIEEEEAFGPFREPKPGEDFSQEHIAKITINGEQKVMIPTRIYGKGDDKK